MKTGAEARTEGTNTRRKRTVERAHSTEKKEGDHYDDDVFQ